MELIKYTVKNRIGYITLDRAEKRNALNSEMVTELKDAFDQAEKDQNCKVIVLQAEGKVFCAGADLGYLQQLQDNTYDENLADSTHLMELFKQIYTCSKVVIAKVHGHAIAGGCGLATVCDFSFTVPEAKFGYTEVKIGFIPAIVKVFLIRKIGEGKSKELLLSGELIDAQKSLDFGLVNRVYSTDALTEEVNKFASMLCATNSAQSMAYTKQMIADVQNMTLDEGLNHAATMNATARASEDCKKGIASFLNKEKLNW